MLSSLLQSMTSRPSSQHSAFSSQITYHTSSVAARASAAEEQGLLAADYGSAYRNNDRYLVGEEEDDGEDVDDDEDALNGSGLTPLLPIFEAAKLGEISSVSTSHLEFSTDRNLTDALPVYDLTHTIRLLVVPRCETTLSWDQIRSPQVSQFLVKPIQQQILASHFSRATLYALIANCLQFRKESLNNPGQSGTSRTRALVCELLAMKLLKEFSTRELVCPISQSV